MKFEQVGGPDSTNIRDQNCRVWHIPTEITQRRNRKKSILKPFGFYPNFISLKIIISLEKMRISSIHSKNSEFYFAIFWIDYWSSNNFAPQTHGYHVLD
ncbi:hypothetical protein B0E43_05600 [Algoriphagus sp. A40]|nr:hypothetical protein B0E43_05600 [Algoriphagus sp. A40]